MRLKAEGVDTVYITAASHQQWPFKVSSYYINTIKKLFVENGFHVALRLGGTPDEDLIFSSHFRNFVLTNSGYGWMFPELTL